MIPIKYFWSEHPKEEEIHEAMKLVEDGSCVVVIKWRVGMYGYSMTVKQGMSFDQCEQQIPRVYGL